MRKISILITGASGFIGSALVKKIESDGYTVLRTKHSPHSSEIGIPLEALEGLEGVIHLAGENIASARWSKQKKEKIFLSRVRGTFLLSHALLRVKVPPRFFFSASAVGYYGNRGDEILTEESRQGSGFLADVCGKWEEASDVLKQRGVRVIHGRFGSVLDPDGGILQKLLPIFKMGLGMQMGDGKQWMSWITRDDLVRAIEWIVFKTDLAGAVNCCSPHPVTQKEWIDFLRHFAHRPVFLKLPKPLVRWIFGQMGEELFLSSIRAKPQKLLDTGFQFRHPLLKEKLWLTN